MVELSSNTFTSGTPTPPLTSKHLAVLGELVEDGNIEASDLVHLAMKIGSGEDTTFISAVKAILPLKGPSPGIFQQGLRALLVQRGLRDDVPVQQQIDGSVTSTRSAPRPSPLRTDVKEIVVVCIDVSGSMQTPFECDQDTRTVDRTRLQAVKQCFYGFRDQTQAHDDGHLLGLLSFSSDVTIHTNPTSNFDVFEDVIDDMVASGSTAIYGAIAVACTQMLAPLAIKHPAASLRVLVLSDGQNNSHKVTADAALKALAAEGAVCDCMLIGGSKNNADDGLRRLVAASEGKCVEIAGLADAFEALESSAMISLTSRHVGHRHPDIGREALRSRMAKVLSVDSVAAAPMQRGAILTTRKPSKTGSCVPLDVALKFPSVHSSSFNKRLVKELQTIDAAQLDNFYVFPRLDEDGSLSKALGVIFLGKRDHIVYGGRAYLLSVELPPDYPFRPPRIRFMTPVYHYAVSTDGTICSPILQEAWSPAQSLRSVLSNLDLLLHDPQKADPSCNCAIRSWLSDLLRTDPDRYYSDGVAHSKIHGKELKRDSEIDMSSLLRLFS